MSALTLIDADGSNAMQCSSSRQDVCEIYSILHGKYCQAHSSVIDPNNDVSISCFASDNYLTRHNLSTLNTFCAMLATYQQLDNDRHESTDLVIFLMISRVSTFHLETKCAILSNGRSTDHLSSRFTQGVDSIGRMWMSHIDVFLTCDPD